MGLGTTRYYHYFTQYSDEINGSYMSDPIATYAAAAVAQGDDIGSSVVEALQRGRAVNLRRYYQYAKARFGNRFWNWELRTLTGNTQGTKLSKKLGKLFIPSSKPYTYIASVTEDFQRLGPYLNQKVSDTFGINEFQDTYNGKQYVASNLVKTDKGVTVLKSADTPVTYEYLPDFPEPSMGVIYWDYSDPVLKSSSSELELYLNSTYPKGYPTKKGNKVLLKEWAEEFNPFGDSESGSIYMDSKTADELDAEQATESKINTNYTRKIYRKYAEVHNISTRYLSGDTHEDYSYTITTETYEITYNKENFAYITESGLTNSPALKYFIDKQKDPSRIEAGRIGSDTNPDVFKLYPYLPVKDFGEDAWEETWLVPKLSKDDEIVKLQRIIDEALKKQSEDLDHQEEHEPNQSNPRLKSKDKKSSRRDSSKLYTYNGQQYTLRALQRRLNRYLSQKRKIKFNKLYNPAKELSESATKRHIDNLSEMLGVDYEAIASSMIADKNYQDGTTNTRQRSIMPSVNFSSNLSEIQAYWFYMIKRLYKLYGEERDFAEWNIALTTANNLNDLPMKHFTWKNQSGLDYGGMSWMFIRKLELDGDIRKIKRYRRIKEIKRGKPITVNNIDELKAIIEPPKEFAEDKYHTSKNGTQHNIGGQKYTTKGTMDRNLDISKVLKDFNYTFFCKEGSNGKLEVYAVAGLCFYSKMIKKIHWATAWFDLDLQYARNYNKYIGKKKDFNSFYDMKHRISKRHYYITRMAHFGIMPVDYNIIRRIGGAELERMAQRIPILYGFTHTESKGKAGWVKTVMHIVQAIIAVVGFVLALPSGYSSLAAAEAAIVALEALVTAVAISIAVQLALKYVLVPLLKLIGLKGIVAMIVAIIILIVAMYLGGQIPNNQSVLPYGSEVGKQTATQVSGEVVKSTSSVVDSVMNSINETINTFTNNLAALTKAASNVSTETITQALKRSMANVVTEFTNMSAFKAAGMLTQVGFDTMNSINADKMNSIQAQSEAETERYESAQRELNELQETVRNASYDVKAVLEAQRMRFRMYDPTSFLASNTTPDTYSASFDYLSNFINMKLNVDPATTDVAMTPDFSFANPYKIS